MTISISFILDLDYTNKYKYIFSVLDTNEFQKTQSNIVYLSQKDIKNRQQQQILQEYYKEFENFEELIYEFVELLIIIKEYYES